MMAKVCCQTLNSVLFEDHSPIETEQREEHPKIKGDDGVLAQFVERAGLEARLVRRARDRRRRRSRHILHRNFPDRPSSRCLKALQGPFLPLFFRPRTRVAAKIFRAFPF